MTSLEDGKTKYVLFFFLFLLVKSQVSFNSRDLVEQLDLCDIIL